jgi:hypothetical protein
MESKQKENFVSDTTNITLKCCGYIAVPRDNKESIKFYKEIEKKGILLREKNGIFQVKDSEGKYHLSVKGRNINSNVKFGFKNGLMSLAKMLYLIRNFRMSLFQYVADIMRTNKIEVHHINKDTWDNSPRNLTLTTHDKHKRFDCEKLASRYDFASEMKVENEYCEQLIKKELEKMLFKF